MKQYFILIIAFAFLSFSATAQTIEVDQNVIDPLKKKTEDLVKQIDSISDLVKYLTKIKGKNSTSKELTKLKADYETLTEDRNKYKNGCDTIYGQFYQLKIDTAKLNKNTKSLSKQVADLTKERDKYKKGCDTIYGQFNQLKLDTAKFTKNNKILIQQVGNLESEKTSLTTANSQLNKQKTELIANLVSALTKSSELDLAKIKNLLTQLNDPNFVNDLDTQKVVGWKGQLERAKKIAGWVKNTLNVLSKKYTANEVNTQLSEYPKNAKANHPKLEYYNDLLETYCEINNDTYVAYQKADIYKIQDKPKCISLMRKALGKLPYEYAYLRKELKKKISNPMYSCIINQQKCK